MEVILDDDPISLIEDTLKGAMVDIGCFALVETAGEAPIKSYPLCTILLASGNSQDVKNRDVEEFVFSMFVTLKNLRSQADAQKGFYAVRQKMRQKLHGQSLNLQDGNSPFWMIATNLIGYTKGGMISYEIKIKTTWYGDVLVDRG